MNQFEERFNAAFQKELESRLFEAEDITGNWCNTAQMALYDASLISLGVDADVYNALDDACNSGKMTMYEFAVLNNNLERLSPNQLGVSLVAYIDIMKTSSRLAKLWNQLVEPIRKEVEKRVREQVAEEMQKNKARGLLKQPVGEA